MSSIVGRLYVRVEWTENWRPLKDGSAHILEYLIWRNVYKMQDGTEYAAPGENCIWLNLCNDEEREIAKGLSRVRAPDVEPFVGPLLAPIVGPWENPSE